MAHPRRSPQAPLWAAAVAGLLLAALPTSARAQSSLRPTWPTTLKYCVADGDCTHFPALSQTTLPIDHMDATVSMHYSTQASWATTMIWQVSKAPYPDPWVRSSPGLLGEGFVGIPSTRNAHFSIDLGDLHRSRVMTASESELQAIDLSPTFNVFAMGSTTTPTRYYLRALPWSANGQAGPASSLVTITFTGDPSTLVPDTLPPAYDVSILSFGRVQPRTQTWGCLYIDYVPPWLSTQQRQYYESYRTRPLCPPSWAGVGEPGVLESFLDFAMSAVNWVSEAYEALQDGALDFVVNGINDQLGIELCNPDCRDLLESGLEASLLAVGIPPELPNAKELLENGKEYLVKELAQAAPILSDCPSCIEKLRGGIQWMADQSRQRTIREHCDNVELAHANGRQPLCLPSGVKAHLATGSAEQPAKIVLRVRRRTDVGTNLTTSQLARYRIETSFIGTNTSFASSIRLPTGMCENSDGHRFPCGERAFPLPNPVVGQLFYAPVLTVPTLAPGESVDIPLVLPKAHYWLPGHKEYMDLYGYDQRGMPNDWGHLYDGATLRSTVRVTCPSVTMSGACVDTATRTDSNLHL